jgi:mannose-6-phosphate isomerase-like protein (cupin superfamily)
MEKINLRKKFELFQDHWNPRIVGELNGQHVKLVKLKGEFIWHQHEIEDELFFVVKGILTMEFRDRTETVSPGEFIIVPRKTEHRPVADEEVLVMLFEPASTLNTGDQESERTKNILERI